MSVTRIAAAAILALVALLVPPAARAAACPGCSNPNLPVGGSFLGAPEAGAWHTSIAGGARPN